MLLYLAHQQTNKSALARLVGLPRRTLVDRLRSLEATLLDSFDVRVVSICALLLLQEDHGYPLVVTDLAEECGISRQTLYAWYHTHSPVFIQKLETALQVRPGRPRKESDPC